MSEVSDWSVIVVDDEPDNLDVLSLILNYRNAKVQLATSGQQCLEFLENGIPTLLLIDIQMPVMSGYDLLKQIRANPNWGKIPAIAITAHAMEGDRERVLAAGFDGYITKPIEVMRIIEQIQGILD